VAALAHHPVARSAARPPRPVVSLDLPRHRHGEISRAPGRRDVSRRHRRARGDRRAVRQTAASLYARPARCRTGPGTAGARQFPPWTLRAIRRGAERAEHSERLPAARPLPAGTSDLCAARTATRGRARALGGVPSGMTHLPGNPHLPAPSEPERPRTASEAVLLPCRDCKPAL